MKVTISRPYEPEPLMSRMGRSMNRAAFFRTTGVACALLLLERAEPAQALPRVASGASPLPHPDPRPGITAKDVLPAQQIGTTRKVVQAYDAARTYPGVFDGIACGCGCVGGTTGHRSLLTCYETMQPTGCAACEDEALLVARLAKDGKALGEIRAAVDAKFG
jgi:uncharacterized protein with PCYCGC motif